MMPTKLGNFSGQFSQTLSSHYFVQRNQMSDRSIIEKTSWVAGILSAAISVFLLFKPDAAKPEATVPSKEHSSISTSSAPSTSLAASGAQTPKSSSAKDCEGEMGSLSSALESAQNIYSTAKRDDLYLRVARQALCIGDQEVYEDSVAKIYTTAVRDQAYSDGVDHFLGTRGSDTALIYAKKIYKTTVRDAALTRIALRVANR